jgi:hypothetical protein
MRVRVSIRRMLVGKLAVFLSCRGVLFGLFMLANRVMVLRLMMVMCGRMVVSSCMVMVLTRWMFRCLCHLDALCMRGCSLYALSGVGMFSPNSRGNDGSPIRRSSYPSRHF